VTAQPTARRRSLLRHPDFARLWSAATISLFGTQVSQVAIPVIAVLLLKASPGEVGLLTTIEFLPFLLFTLPAGVWVDRLSRRRILIVADVGRALMLASIPIAYALGVLTIWQLYLVGFTNGVMTVFFDVADMSYLPTILDRDELVEGNSKLQISNSSAQILGQPVGGGLVALLSAPFAVIIDAVSYIGSALLIFSIRRKEQPGTAASSSGGVSASEAGDTPGSGVSVALEAAVAANEPRSSMRSDIAAGLRYIAGQRFLRNIAASTGTSNLCTNITFAIFAVYVYRDLAMSPAQVGIFGGIGGAGVLIGALIASRVGERFGVGPTIVGSMAVTGPFVLLIPLATADTAFWFLSASFFFTGLLNVVYNVNQVSLRQAITPERMLGRMNATMRFLVWGTIPLGSLIGAGLSELIGVHLTIWLGAVLGLLPFLFVMLSPVRSLRRIPDLEPSEA
jgi:MFS family permease